MLKLKNNKIKVRCSKCNNIHSIKIKKTYHRYCDFEEDYTFYGKSKCSHCNKKLEITIDVNNTDYNLMEFINNIKVHKKSCELIDEITAESFTNEELISSDDKRDLSFHLKVLSDNLIYKLKKIKNKKHHKNPEKIISKLEKMNNLFKKYNKSDR